MHELVHVVQQYRRRPPGWLVEGIPDYIRWYLYEPQSRGAEISPPRVSTQRKHNSPLKDFWSHRWNQHRTAHCRVERPVQFLSAGIIADGGMHDYNS